MRLLLPLTTAHRTVRRAGFIGLAGVLLMVLAAGWLRGVGLVTGLMLAMAGLCAFSFRGWLRERGLWMLASLALAVYVPLYTMILYDNYKRHLNGPPAVVWGMTADSVIAAAVVWQTIRLLATVIWFNRRLVRLPGGIAAVRISDADRRFGL